MSLSLSPCYAFDLKQVEIPVQLGLFASNPGQAQHINIQGLIGDQYTNTNSRTENALIGAGFFIPGLDKDRFKLLDFSHFPRTVRPEERA